MQQGLVEFSKKRNKVKADKDGLIGDARLVKIEGAGMELRDYQTVNFKGQDLILDLAASGVHYVATARETDEKVSVKDVDGKISSVSTGKKIPDGFKGMTYNAKTVVRMFRDEDGQVCAYIEKDRTHVYPENAIVEDPTLVEWQKVIDKTADKKEFVVKNDLTKSVEVEQELYAKEVLGSVGAPVEEVKSEAPKTASVDVAAMKKLIEEKKKALSPVGKKEIKEKLEAAGLPVMFKNVTDPEILTKVLEIFG